MLKLLVFLAVSVSSGAYGATIYLCEGYSGGKFWSSVHCREKQALIDRMETVPDGLPFNQQVDMASQQRDKAQRLYEAPQSQGGSTVTQTTTTMQQGTKATCDTYTVRIAQLDAMSRQPQSAQMQDYLTAERRRLRDEQFRLRC